ncbi:MULTISPECIES: hypothetical protein [unclassified Nonomuraea]|uniref:hypothetical protein n=1 Tax=unclassified Nonomuraea TaxID=2593643 RepID=UPI00340B12FC
MASAFSFWSAATLIVATMLSDPKSWAVPLLIGGSVLAVVGSVLTALEWRHSFGAGESDVTPRDGDIG